MSGFLSRKRGIGIALGADAITAALPDRGSRATVTVPGAGETASAEALAGAFQRLAERLATETGRDTAGSRVRVALLPPLADVRLIRLPPLRPQEAESVIRRDAARHFVGGASPRLVAVIPAANGENGVGAVFVAAAAPTALVEAVHAAARAVGWRTDAVVPAHGAWLVAARGSASLIAVHEGVVHMMRVEGGRCSAIRRIPADLPAEILRSLGAVPDRALLFADTRERGSLAARLTGAGWKVEQGRLTSAAEAAALNAWRSRLELVAPAAAAERGQRMRRTALRAAALAVLLLAGTAGLELWGARRELAAVRAERAAIRAEVEPLLATRDSIERIGAEAQAIRRLESSSPRWTRALFDLALLLPRDTHITSLHTVGDTLVVEAIGARAGAALQALSKAGSLAGIRLVGTVERDLEDGATTTESFRFRALLKPPLAVSTRVGGAVGEGGEGGGP